jgi:hypothetical protein
VLSGEGRDIKREIIQKEISKICLHIYITSIFKLWKRTCIKLKRKKWITHLIRLLISFKMFNLTI